MFSEIKEMVKSVDVGDGPKIKAFENAKNCDKIEKNHLNGNYLDKIEGNEDHLKQNHVDFPSKIKPNDTVTIDNKTYYGDDNGNVYRLDNALLPNNRYEKNGYIYETDYLGRIKSVEGKLYLESPHKRNMENVKKFEGQDYKETDDRGHFIGHQFGGSDRLENLFPQDSHINQNDFHNFENSLAKEVKDGKDVYLKIEPCYESSSNRPTDLIVTYSINGAKDFRIFPNDRS